MLSEYANISIKFNHFPQRMTVFFESFLFAIQYFSIYLIRVIKIKKTLLIEISFHIQDQFLNDCEGNDTSNVGSKEASTYDEQECTVGEQLFLSNPSRSNENLIDSTAGSCDPLFANQSLEQINLGKSLIYSIHIYI